MKRFENRIGSVLVCDGAIFCIRSLLFDRLDPDLANDLETPMRIGAAGYWITHEPAALVFERDTTSPLEEFQRRRRMCAQGALAMMTLLVSCEVCADGNSYRISFCAGRR